MGQRLYPNSRDRFPLSCVCTAFYDIASLKQYIRLHPPTPSGHDQSYSYLENPYHLFTKPYLVKVFHTSAAPVIELKSSSICVHQRKIVNTLKLLKSWSQELLYNELIKRITYWEEQLDNYAISAIRIGKLSNRNYKIKGNEIHFSSRLIDFDKEQINLVVLAAFCKFSKKTRKNQKRSITCTSLTGEHLMYSKTWQISAYN
ncbi:hypothetical protein KUH03_38385 [Sphingobacterium sp. E70]|uniref:hypothetical protein n=1 Tax=Sphingobacterium sp. E70 TaxID=2853439 RepID=UPI00211BDA07|nr:hypothetical protein [Sphingobacterium sp. E70]ULT24721.1 hypothetical protein KUH03_38385 [Sphingobacterium sp. E70]